MRAILINPYTQTVSEVDCSGELDGEAGMYNLLGAADPMFAHIVEAIRLGGTIDLWIDEEAHLSDGRPVFQLADGPTIGGAALLLANDGEGNCKTLPDMLTLDLLKTKLQWTNLMTTGDFMPTTESKVDHPVLGPDTTVVVQGDPIFREAAGFFVWQERNNKTELASSVHFTTRGDALAFATAINIDAPERKAAVREASAQ